MGLKAGIVGLPNVGKSTLFNAITNSHVEAANYPFATINPNVGSVFVKDKRVDSLSKMFNPKRTIYTTFEFYDIAGLVKGASKGEGLGNQFLSKIRETDAIIEVVRCFTNSDIVHVENSVDPIRDIGTINLELIFSDLDTVQNRLAKVENKAKISKDKEAIVETNVLTKLKEHLNKEKSARSLQLTEEESKIVKNYNLLTIKPIIYVANVSDEDLQNIDSCENYLKVRDFAAKEHAQCIPICCEIESELSSYSPQEKEEFLASIGAKESGLDSLVQSAYKLLNLSTFFTVGADEVRARTFINGMLAPDCAGIIHTDFKKGFIRAEVYSYNDIMVYKTEQALKDAGKLRIEGKDYVAKDGDIFFFRFNV
ncbi:MAG: redox-regulated ATPase YchF [Erysipelotrichaceae bacterium]|nr:redox-regulated ATPase YchF [Erysipelotrichaceae bacterium]MCB9499950.1 redox-regulated ATPase YchF [Erysipelotrichaceae bacterium]